jgi:hypothetical protein
MVKSAASAATYPPNSFASPPSGSAPPVQPSWHGFIHTTHDALIVLEACLQGKLNHISRRPHDRERSNLIVSGNVFVYEENASGIKRWTDGTTWSPSRIMGNFLVYRELKDPWPAGQKKVAQKRKRSSAEQNLDSSPAASQASGNFISKNPEEDRRLVGSLVDSYGFKPDGLVKRTLTISLNGVSHHIICYYKVSEVKNGNLHRPLFDRALHNITPRSELVNSNQLKFPINDPDELDPMLDQYSTGTLPTAPTQQSLFSQNYTLHDTTSFQAQQSTNLSVHSELSAASNLPQLVQATTQMPITSYPHIPVSSGAVSGIATPYNPVESLMITPPELQIPFKPQYPLHDSGFPTPEHSTHSPDDYHSPEEVSSKRPRVDSTPVTTMLIGPAQTLASLNYGNHIDHTDLLVNDVFSYVDLATNNIFSGPNAWYGGSVVENTMYTVPTPQFSNVGSY